MRKTKPAEPSLTATIKLETKRFILALNQHLEAELSRRLRRRKAA